ncbi:MAG: hypothetical protein K8W52_03470 [Deltaproteobacteria bacterium]|nr:hypothetical protein [Deltaproteobacteria bacterium]
MSDNPSFETADGINVANTLLGVGATAAGLLPGMGGLIGGALGLTSGIYSTATSSTPIDEAVNGAGVAGGLLAMPATLMGMAGMNTGVALGGLTTIGEGLGMSGAAAGLGSAGGIAGLAGIAGNVLAAGAAGYGAGSLIANVGDKFGHNGTIWGQNEDTGKDRSSWDWSVDQGAKVDKWIDGMTGGKGQQGNSTLGTIAGAGTSALLGIGTAGLGLGTSVINGIGSLF